MSRRTDPSHIERAHVKNRKINKPEHRPVTSRLLREDVKYNQRPCNEDEGKKPMLMQWMKREVLTAKDISQQ